jgi:hypothetical protein
VQSGCSDLVDTRLAEISNLGTQNIIALCAIIAGQLEEEVIGRIMEDNLNGIMYLPEAWHCSSCKAS